MRIKKIFIAIAVLNFLGAISELDSLKADEVAMPPQNNQNVSSDKLTSVQVEVAFPNLTFDRPVDFEVPPDGSHRVFIVQQPGTISVFKNMPNIKTTIPFLDISGEVFCGHMEEGLLGLAFHPRFKKNGYFYVYYTLNHPRRSIVARYRVSASNSNQADRNSKKVILEVRQPYGNHKGGRIAFGPDGYLYIALGDGGSGGDPHGNGQNRKTLLGKILRIDVDHPANWKNYGIPVDNPFVENKLGYRDEIFAYGFRNPWRFSFDPLTGWLWAADVGQDKPNEEIDIVTKGKNYGWNIMEGWECFKPPVGCHRGGLELPIWQYTNNMGRSITGGFVYRGKEISGLDGKYIYGDFVSGRIWALEYDGKKVVSNVLISHDSGRNISSFGIDENNEIYFCAFDGRIYKLKRIQKVN